MASETLLSALPRVLSASDEFASLADRWPRFDDMPADAGERMQRAVVAVIGLGSVGRQIAEHSARMGVGRLKLFDHGNIKLQSLLTHAGVFADEIGESKARSAASMIRRIRPTAHVEVFAQSIQQVAVVELLDADFIAFATDNLAAEVCIGELAAQLGKPLLQMSVQGESLLVHARKWTNHGDGPCPRCLYNAAEEANLWNGQRFTCEGASGSQHARSEPTRSVSALCSLAGAMGATIVLRHLLSLGEPLTDEIVELCGYTWETWRTPTRRRADCPVDHELRRIAQMRKPLATRSLRDVADSCDIAWDEMVDFEVDSAVFAESAVCEMGHRQPIGRFISLMQHGLQCDSCGSELIVPGTLSRARVPASMLSGLSERPLGDIAPATPRWVTIRDGSATWLVTGGAR